MMPAAEHSAWLTKVTPNGVVTSRRISPDDLARFASAIISGMITDTTVTGRFSMMESAVNIVAGQPNPYAFAIAGMYGADTRPFFGPVFFHGGLDEIGFPTGVTRTVVQRIMDTVWDLDMRPIVRREMVTQALKWQKKNVSRRADRR